MKSFTDLFMQEIRFCPGYFYHQKSHCCFVRRLVLLSLLSQTAVHIQVRYWTFKSSLIGTMTLNTSSSLSTALTWRKSLLFCRRSCVW